MSETAGVPELAIAKVAVTYKLSDYFAAMARRWRAWLVAFAVLAAFVVLLPLIFALLDGCSLLCAWYSMDWRFSAYLFSFVVAWLFVAPVLSFLMAKRRGHLGPIAFTLTDAGVELENRDARSLLFWERLDRVKKIRSGFLFYLKRSRSLGIPRRAFASDQEFEAFAAAAETRWRQARSPTSAP